MDGHAGKEGRGARSLARCQQAAPGVAQTGGAQSSASPEPLELKIITVVLSLECDRQSDGDGAHVQPSGADTACWQRSLESRQGWQVA